MLLFSLQPNKTGDHGTDAQNATPETGLHTTAG